MNILITGATGFIGTVLVPKLLSHFPKSRILCIVQNTEKFRSIYNIVQNIECCRGVDKAAINRFNPEYIIHLAAYNTSDEGEQVIEPLISSNILFGVRLLEFISHLNGIKLFINTGSFSQYAQNDAYLYSASKSAFDVFLRFYANHHNLKYITAVPYSVYGGKSTVKRLFDYIVDSMDAVEPVKMTPGLQELDFIHVEDVANFYISAIEHAQKFTSGDIIHLGTGRTYTLREVVDIFERISSKKCNIEWGGRPYRDTDIMYACAPTHTAPYKIWSPQITIAQGIKLFISNFD